MCEKYLNPPKTTDFGILFLPIEGLFAEVMRRTGLIETIQGESRVIIAGFWQQPRGKSRSGRLLTMTDDTIGKSFTVIFTNGDLPTNPMSLRECAVCGGVFTRDESQERSEARCQPSLERPFAIVTDRGWKSEHKTQTCQ